MTADKTQNKKVSILGCGWVGKALKSSLLSEGYVVHCLTRDIIANAKSGWYEVDVLVIALPPRVGHIAVLEKTLSYIAQHVQVILLSSISFYHDKVSIVESEKRVQELHPSTVVLRLGGLMGYDRIAGIYTAGQTLSHDAKTNYVHRDDVVAIIEKLIKSQITSEIFDIVAPEQTTKKKIFLQNAEQFGFEKTVFLEDHQNNRDISPDSVCKALGYTFIKQSVEHFWET